LIPGRGKIFFFPPEVSRPALRHTQLPSVKGVPGVFLGLKWLESEVDHLTATSIEHRNVWIYACTHPCAFMASVRAPLPIC